MSLDLRHRTYAPSVRDLEAACADHCYVAAEAAYHLFAKREGFVPFVFKHDDGTTHWWLECLETGEILDPTEPQLKGKRFRYENGRRATFLTPRPSKRAAELMRRVRAAGR